VCVHLSGSKVGVTEKLLNASEIGACIEHMSGVTVPEFMRRELWIETSHREVLLQSELDIARVKWRAFFGVREESGGIAGRWLWKQSPITSNGIQSMITDGNQPFFLSFARNARLFFAPVDVLGSQPTEFADAQPAGIDGFEQG